MNKPTLEQIKARHEDCNSYMATDGMRGELDSSSSRHMDRAALIEMLKAAEAEIERLRDNSRLSNEELQRAKQYLDFNAALK